MPFTREELERVRELEAAEDSAVKALKDKSFGATGDKDVDWLIKVKVAEDRRKPPANIPNRPKAEPITQFRGPYRFLSNFQECEIHALGHVFNSTEAAYQAAKRVDDFEFHAKIAAMGPKDAMHYGRSLPITTPYWHEHFKFDVMKSVCEQKFSQHEWLRFSLLGTRDATLEEGNSWGDKVWGTDLNDPLPQVIAESLGQVYNGENHLGKILMEVRRMLRVGML